MWFVWIFIVTSISKFQADKLGTVAAADEWILLWYLLFFN